MCKFFLTELVVTLQLMNTIQIDVSGLLSFTIEVYVSGSVVLEDHSKTIFS